jgi:GT2 family glycosyltransferase
MLEQTRKPATDDRRMARSPTVDVVIVNFNSRGLLARALRSVASTTTDSSSVERVVVVDNASSDESLHGIDDIDSRLVLRRNETNLGYGAAANVGATASSAEYILFLNPDAVLPENSIDQLVSWMDRSEHSAVGICGPQLLDERGEVSKSCARFPTARDFLAKSFGLDKLLPGLFPSWYMFEWDHASTREVDHLQGACVLIRTQLFSALGGFDERFFLYFEDVDLSLRARRLGSCSVYLTHVRVLHKGGGSSEHVRAQSVYHGIQSRIRYSFKHLGVVGALAVTLATLLIEPFSRLVWAISNHSARDLGATIWVTWRLWVTLPRTVRLLMRNA